MRDEPLLTLAPKGCCQRTVVSRYWYSRYMLSWSAEAGSNTLEGRFCLEALHEALSLSKPEIFNTDLGSQFTAREYTERLLPNLLPTQKGHLLPGGLLRKSLSCLNF